MARGGRGNNKRSSRRAQKQQKDASFISLGTITCPKKFKNDDDYQDCVDGLMGVEATFSVKVFLNDEDEITLRSDDRIMIKFKDYPKDPDFAVGRVFLIDEED